MVGPVAHDVRAVLDHLAGNAVVELAFDAVGDVVDRTVDPLPLGTDCRHLVAVRGIVAPLLRFHHGLEQRLGSIRILVDEGSAHAERLFGMLVPQLAGGDRRVADALVDELQVPRLANAEAVHGADLHVGDHLRRRDHDRLDVLVGIDPAGGEPIADPEIVRAAREGHRGLDGLAGCLLFFQRHFEWRRVHADL